MVYSEHRVDEHLTRRGKVTTGVELRRMATETIWEQIMQAAKTGQFFSCTFLKRTTGEERSGVFRVNVQKHLAGGEAAYDFRSKGLIPVWEPAAAEKAGDPSKGYRSIPVENILQISLNV